MQIQNILPDVGDVPEVAAGACPRPFRKTSLNLSKASDERLLAVRKQLLLRDGKVYSQRQVLELGLALLEKELASGSSQS